MKWTEEDIRKLEWFYENNVEMEEMTLILNRSKSAIKNKAYKLEITKPKNYTEEEIEYFKKNYKSYNLSELAEEMNRPKTNLCRLAKELGLERTHKKKENAKTEKDMNGVWHKKGWVRVPPETISINTSVRMKEWYKNNEHPKGMLGKKHSLEYRKQISERVKQYFKDVTPEQLETRRVKMVRTKIKNNTLSPKYTHKNPYSRTRSGKRSDLNNIYMRSSWEANIARYLNFNNVSWEFEPKVFIFEDIKKGCVSYLPDFYLPDLDIWIEVKGWMDKKSETKLRRFSKYYPEESSKLWLIDAKEYKIIEKKYKTLIDNWE